MKQNDSSHLKNILNYLTLFSILTLLSACGSDSGSAVINNNADDDIININNEILTGTAFDDSARGIIIDEARSRILITGKTSGDLNGQTNAGAIDIFVTEYDMNLNEQWTTLIGTVADDEGRAVAVNSTGDIYIAGSTAGNLGSESNQGLDDAFLAKLDPSGNLQWVRLIGTVADDDARGLAIDSNDNIYIAGASGDSIDGQPYAGGVSSDILLAKYDGTGNRIWLRLVGGSFSDAIREVTIDSSDNIYVCGWFSVSGAIPGQGGAQIYLAKYDTAGNIIWSEMLGETPGNDFCQDVTTDEAGNIYLGGGSFTDLNGITNQGDRDIVVAKYSSTGTMLWANMIGTAAEERSFGISISPTNTLYATGRTSGDLNNITNLGSEDIFVANFDSDGNLLSVNLYGTIESDRAIDIDISSAGSIFITGRSQGNLDSNTNAGGNDIFIKKL